MADEVTDAPDVDAGVNSETENQETSTDTPNEEGGGTILDKTSDDVKILAPADWPEDWRDKLSGDDNKVRKRLDRFKSPADIFKSFQALEQKLSNGDVKATLPDDATDDQIAAYRKENGIPETADGYLENLPDGLVVGEADKELFGAFTERMHGKNADPAIVGEALAWYNDLQAQTAAEQSEADKAFERETMQAKMSEWGGEYQANINAITAFLDVAPSDADGTTFKEMISGARFADGRAVINHPATLDWLLGLANDANPAGFVSPSSGMSQAETVQDEIAKIEKFMRTNRAEYDKDTKMQERLRALYVAEEKLSA